MSIFGNLGQILELSSPDSFTRRPVHATRSLTVSLPKNTPPEIAQKIFEHASEQFRLDGMSPAEQLQYLKEKNGFR